MSAGFWSGMPTNIRYRLFAGLVFILVAIAVFSQLPILGIVLMTLPIFWTVFVVWTGAESGLGFGPYHNSKETALSYTLRRLWRTSVLTRIVFATLGVALVVGGLGWISTEKMRAAAAEPTLPERVTTAAETAKATAEEKASGWIDTAKGWFTFGDEDPSPRP